MRLETIKARLSVGDATLDKIDNRLDVISRRLSETGKELLALEIELKKPLARLCTFEQYDERCQSSIKEK